MTDDAETIRALTEPTERALAQAARKGAHRCRLKPNCCCP